MVKLNNQNFSSSFFFAKMCNCQPGWDIRCMCEPYYPQDRPFEDFSKCPMAVQNAIWHIENVSFAELPEILTTPSLLTCKQFSDIVRPILNQWFKYSPQKEAKVEQVIEALVNDPEREYADKLLDGKSDEENEDSETAEAIRLYNNDKEDPDTEDPHSGKSKTVQAVQAVQRG